MPDPSVGSRQSRDQQVIGTWAADEARVAEVVNSKLKELRGYRALSVSVLPYSEGSGYVAYVLIEKDGDDG